jgi:hypothetical protein
MYIYQILRAEVGCHPVLEYYQCKQARYMHRKATIYLFDNRVNIYHYSRLRPDLIYHSKAKP